MLKRLLIANRGEIACRIIRTARRLGIETVAVYSDADRHALHVELADQALHIGGSPATESYLAIDRIVATAKAAGADAVHPGYGFLAESAAFAEALTAAGIAFVGPSASAMRALGDKAAARDIARRNGVPVVPGYDGASQSLDALRAEADRIGYPLLIKAVAGGGGRGMRAVDEPTAFAAMLESARREARGAFADDRVILERLVSRPRHIEVQVFADRTGNVVHLFERECTLQRRHQKVIEEAPAAAISPQLRTPLTDAAVGLARAAGYEGAGTVEFLIEGGQLSAGAPWYFIEMNTRLQVEHPVTEAITGLDLVEWQLRVASGEPLPLGQHQITCKGHAIEARICAEDPARNFQPASGPIVAWSEPAMAGIRIDTGFGPGRTIPSHYDSLLAKMICHRDSRKAALHGLAEALEAFHIAGPRTNTHFLHRLVRSDALSRGRIDTGYIDRNMEALTARDRDPAAIVAGARALLAQRAGPSSGRTSVPAGFQLGGERHVTYSVLAEDEPVDVAVFWHQGTASYAIDGQVLARGECLNQYPVVVSGQRAFVHGDLQQTVVAWPDWSIVEEAEDAGNLIVAPITGRIASVAVSTGDNVTAGTTIAVVEAMKMEHIVKAPRAGTIGTLEVYEGDQVAAGQTIATFEGEQAV